MLLSLAFIFLGGIILGWIFEKMRLPSLLGMLLCGILLGPYALNLLDAKVLDISSELRQIALIIILIRAGLNLNIDDLKKVGRPAILMCFIPACAEIIAMIFFAPILLGISRIEATVLGAVVAAVSPAVIVPRMIKLIETGYGTNKSIPQMIMAGASVDDVFVIVLFTAFTGVLQNKSMSAVSFFNIPIAIILGLLVGGIIGLLICTIFAKVYINDNAKIIILMSIAFLLVAFEDSLTGIIGFSGLLAVMAMGSMIARKKVDLSKILSAKFSGLWVGAEVFLFVLVGASVDIRYAVKAGLPSLVLVLIVLCFRIFGVFLCLLKTNLNKKEKIFSAIAYMPKATVQAAIGGVPLAMGLSCGSIVLTVAVLSILITAPLGAILIDNTYKKLLDKNR